MKLYLTEGVKNILPNLAQLHPCKLISYIVHSRCETEPLSNLTPHCYVCFSPLVVAATHFVSRAVQPEAAVQAELSTGKS